MIAKPQVNRHITSAWMLRELSQNKMYEEQDKFKSISSSFYELKLFALNLQPDFMLYRINPIITKEKLPASSI